MNNPFDKIVGPMGELSLGNKDESAAAEATPERDEFIQRCLNSAVNLYGIVTPKEVCELYNGYAKNHDAPISSPLSEDELHATVRRILQKIEEKEEKGSFDPSMEDAWCAPIYDPDAGEWLFVYEPLAEADDDEFDNEEDTAAAMQTILRNVKKRRARFSDVPMKTLPEKDFLMYEDPMGDEETTASRNLVKHIKKECCVPKDEADYTVMNIQACLRVNGATLVRALTEFTTWCDYEPLDDEEYTELIHKISPVVSTTRTWNYRGHTQSELVKMGVIGKIGEENVPDRESLFGSGSDYDDFDD